MDSLNLIQEMAAKNASEWVQLNVVCKIGRERVRWPNKQSGLSKACCEK